MRNGAAVVATLLAVLLGGALAVAGSAGGTVAGGVPLFAACVAMAFLVQWVAFVPAMLRRSERFFDLTGSVTYISVAAMAVALGPTHDGRALLLLLLVTAWAGRLGTFLYLRIRRAGSDARFDAIKVSFARFLMTWTLQGLWVTFTLAAALAAITTATRRPLGLSAACGTAIWIMGFVIEAVADEQKRRFRADPGNAGRFIDSGLWAYSRHPNYFGEVLLWIGIAVIAAPVLRGWQWVTMLSPLFVFVLLRYVSGVPLLEQRADARWGGAEDYEAYKARTPVLMPAFIRPVRRDATVDRGR